MPTAMPPARVMITEMTAAKIGRSIKNLAKRHDSFAVRGGSVLRLGLGRFRGGFGRGLRLLHLGLDLLARPDPLLPLHNDAVARFQSRRDDSPVAPLRAEL